MQGKRAQFSKGLPFVLEPGRLVELRILNTNRATASGDFNHPVAWVAAPLAQNGAMTAIYVRLQGLLDAQTSVGGA